MVEQEKKPGAADGKKKKFYGRFAKGVRLGRGMYKSNMQGPESDTFNVGASSE